KELGIVLELCPTSNIKNSTVKDLQELKALYRIIADSGVKFTINTDGPEMYRTNIFKEQNLLIDNGIFTEAEVERAMKVSFESTFIK
ncbi:MAG TPA: adenosine deaminase, partial [Patescibacteria group bacterium]|nr:adenosine deaminase [Patescibacteria group bacterium]